MRNDNEDKVILEIFKHLIILYRFQTLESALAKNVFYNLNIIYKYII